MHETTSEATPPAEEITIKRYACRHIHTTGRRCGSPALRGEQFCYFHHTTRRPAPTTPRPFVPYDAAFDMPSLEDFASIHQAIADVTRRIAANQIEYRRAGQLLYALQIASSNLYRESRARSPRNAQPALEETKVIEDLQLDSTHGPLAPIAEVSEAQDDANPPRQTFADFYQGELRARENSTNPFDPEAEPYPPDPNSDSDSDSDSDSNDRTPITLPLLQATAEEPTAEPGVIARRRDRTSYVMPIISTSNMGLLRTAGMLY